MSQAIEELEERLRQAMLQSDVAELDQLLAPELVFSTFLGEVISKEEDLAAHQSGFLHFHSIELSDTRITRVGASAVVTCEAEIDASFDEDRTIKRFRFLRVWDTEKKQVVAGQATVVYASL